MQNIGVCMDFVKIFRDYGIVLDDSKVEMFEKYYDLLLSENGKYNLTSITDKNDVWLKHFLDSVLPFDVFDKGSSVLDVGGGAGFPSIPLKIVRPDLKLVVIDSVKKKTNFMQLVVDSLKLDNIKIIHSRCEDIAKDTTYREKFDYVVARAVAPLSILLEYTVPMAKIGGEMVLYKGANYKEELENSQNAIKILNCHLKQIKDVYVKECGYSRYFLEFVKTKQTDKKYPRGQNKPRISPLN